ncbi:hypothetical protein FJTKL_04207 [Diaporthe vaccinii]|uniref:Uncharacterized protein n=1 Tax=Diaporthe vaccinii TaxID=105482 RepID=A0ABR4DTE7_9PEZI
MPQTFLTRSGQTLFAIQSIVAFSVFLLAGQREAFPWVSSVTSVGLALWTAIGVPLLLIYRQTLSQKLPWSVLIPLKFFFLFAGVPPSDLYQAGLLMPLSVNIGLVCLVMYNDASPEVTMGQFLGYTQPQA